MPIIEVDQITKSFGTTRAVNGVTFAIEAGEIFGLLGPNGAGKTTTIRILLDIFKADSGRTAILGGPMDEAKKNRIGYLPEERGLYQDIPLERCLVYLATLKGLSHGTASQRIGAYLERFDLADSRRKKVKELSKGMQQKAQIIATLVHRPELIIIDEPFSGLDPVNTQLVKDLLREEHERGATIVMCTHQMQQVEELCERLVLIHHGATMLYGKISDIRRQYASQEVWVRPAAGTPLPALPNITVVEINHQGTRLLLENGRTPQDLLRELVTLQMPLDRFEIAMPSLDEIFIEVVKSAGEAE